MAMALSSQLRKNFATLKLIQLLRKFTWRHLWISVLNAVSLKEIKQLVVEQQPFGVFQVFKSIDTCINLSKSMNTEEADSFSLVSVQ